MSLPRGFLRCVCVCVCLLRVRRTAPVDFSFLTDRFCLIDRNVFPPSSFHRLSIREILSFFFSHLFFVFIDNPYPRLVTSFFFFTGFVLPSRTRYSPYVELFAAKERVASVYVRTFGFVAVAEIAPIDFATSDCVTSNRRINWR